MSKQSEQILEEQLIAQLQKLGYAYFPIADEKALIANFKSQLEKHNQISFSDAEFDKVLNLLNKGSVFEKSKTLRQKQHIVRDNGDNLYFEFLNTEHWCQNQYQVTNQVTQEGKYKNRYDVTILINGLPLVQIELKRRGLELKEAFNQVNRYQRHSFGANSALYQYVQIFIISNGVNTKYYANNRNQSFKQTFYWTDFENKRLTNILNGFTDAFLEPCHISKMICKYIVLNEAYKIPMVLRPYQFYAVEALIDRVKNSNKNGYIWHTTGSGKTLTSFKASQILMNFPEVHKVVFVVDRKDLDYQTTKEFNSFSDGCIDGTDNTANLVKQFIGTYKDKKGEAKNTKLIVTTIQKLNTAISKLKYEKKMADLKEKRIIFIFDECHRSQFGETHNRIKDYFNNAQMFGFTGTPIFADNANKNELGKRTTKDLFEDCLHKYVITDAIKDENVLKFSVEYVGRYKQKDTATEIDIEVEDIDTQELMEDEKRLEKIADYIINNHNRKTHSKDFSAMFCVDSVKSLIRYYDIFKRKKLAGEHNLNIATIFSYAANEDDADANGFIPEEVSVVEEPRALYGLQAHSREKLDEYIEDYNQLYDVKYSTKTSEDFYNYYNDISKKLKDRERQPENVNNRIDVLLVVNMFLTGFDAKKVNTLYVDKNLKYHGLIQAFSRTNRILNEQKSQGNIVVFRNLKNRTDEAITLFSNKEAIEVIIMKPYEDYVAKFDEAFEKLLEITPTTDSINDLETEDDELNFIKAFRDLMRIKNILTAFSDFKWEDLQMNEQLFEDFKSKYLDLYDKVKSNHQKEKVSILEDVDFELELIHRDEINVSYIIQLLIKLKSQTQKDTTKAEKEIFNLLSTEATLRSKRELIEKFILENLPIISDPDNITPAFEQFWNEEQQKEFSKIVQEENLSAEKTEKLIEDYLFAEREPLRDEVLELIEGEKPSLLQRKKLGDRILQRIKDFVETFINGMNLN
ncbi:MAG TPA: type I restriction endonuclease subunit R [Chitinophagales bacterium]|jgi:type I restriction enzyme R subunit|nr:type I restriction endonuclease subunit R [Chitinophagales bacterium]HQV79112.1 type I restriction endonuclease subunit R [Chitinophagales bacterium]HQW79764.1 type I restriction endonuclease subunit R [Chitinophagales bacterium]HRB67133.1 type I restriction endonuclease subunit R [Chitinophagales bacterium]